jgi:glyoxylase-like metal-dependent hydrolase (beta-lactamase superfamily II)
MKGKVQVIDKSVIKVHIYTSETQQATYIIESKNKLVVIDTQWMVAPANEFRAYADSLNKPIERIIISHAHVDHFLGLGSSFSDLQEKVYATEATQQFIQKVGPMILKSIKKQLGDAVPNKIVTPTKIIKVGTFEIDKVNYEIKLLQNGEANEQLLILLPEQNIMIAQDIVFNKRHLYLSNNTLDGWITLLQSLKNDKHYTTILPGHGSPATQSIFDENINYLRKAKNVRKRVKTLGDFKQAMLIAYPSYGGKDLLDLYFEGLFKKK